MMNDSKDKNIIQENRIIQIILIIRGKKVILDSDLALLYGVETKRLNEQVRRNLMRFPDDFMFQLTKEEYENLKSQFATSSSKWGGRRTPPLVYTEFGALQAASILRSEQANKMSIYIVRAFIRFREMISIHKDLSKKVAMLEKRVSNHDQVLADLVSEIRKLIEAPKPAKSKDQMGFILPEPE